MDWCSSCCVLKSVPCGHWNHASPQLGTAGTLRHTLLGDVWLFWFMTLVQGHPFIFTKISSTALQFTTLQPASFPSLFLDKESDLLHDLMALHPPLAPFPFPLAGISLINLLHIKSWLSICFSEDIDQHKGQHLKVEEAWARWLGEGSGMSISGRGAAWPKVRWANTHWAFKELNYTPIRTSKIPNTDNT